MKWLRRHNVLLPAKATKSELMELAFSNLPEKRYVTDELAAKYGIAVLRQGCCLPRISSVCVISYSLPIKYCILNPTELP